MFLLFPFIVIIFTFFSWNICYKINSPKKETTNITGVVGINIKDSIKLVIKPTEDDKNFRNTYINEIETFSFVSSDNVASKYFTAKNIVIAYLIIIFLLILASQKAKKKLSLTKKHHTVTEKN